MHEFVSSTLNGFRFETANPMGVFMRCTSLPDEPIVGERYFPKPGQVCSVCSGIVIRDVCVRA